MLWCAYSGYNVFTLRVDKVFSVEAVFARCRVAAEAYARCGCRAHVSEYHRHYRNCRAPFGRYSFHFAVEDCAFVHPAVEHGADGTPQLFHRVVGEVFACLAFYGFLEQGYELFQLVYAHFVVKLYAAHGFHFLYDGLKRVDVFLVYGLHSQHYVAVHLYEAAVAVVCETFVACLFCQALDNFVVKAEVQYRVHHARHGCACT